MTEYFLIYDNDEPISLGTDELTKVVIKTDKGKKMRVSEFLEAIAQLKVRV